MEKFVFEPAVLDADLCTRVEEIGGDGIREALTIADKIERRDRMGEIKNEIKDAIAEENADWSADAGEAISELVKRATRHSALTEGKRFDGRTFHEVRPIRCEVGYSPRAHGSALFTRGETQAFVTTTLGTTDDARKVEGYDGEFWKRFMLHYNFPPFSVGEARFMRGPGRREIGHGNLAERAIEPVLPTDDDWPYVLRTVSEIFESNGVIIDGHDMWRHAIADGRRGADPRARGRDRNGPHEGRGTPSSSCPTSPARKTTTETWTSRWRVRHAVSPRCRWTSRSPVCRGRSWEQALEQARQNRIHILKTMSEALAAPRAETSRWAPKIISVKIPVDRIRDIIGPGGRIIPADAGGHGLQDQRRGRRHRADRVTGLRCLCGCPEDDLGTSHRRPRSARCIAVRCARSRISVRSSRSCREQTACCTFPKLQSITSMNMREHVSEGQELTVKVVKIEAPNRIRLSLKALTEAERASVEV